MNQYNQDYQNNKEKEQICFQNKLLDKDDIPKCLKKYWQILAGAVDLNPDSELGNCHYKIEELYKSRCFQKIGLIPLSTFLKTLKT